jgi:DME family drug/metabolite transporter
LLKGYLLVLAAAVFWGIIGPAAKIAFSEGVTPMEAAFWRTTLAWFLFAPQALFTGKVGIAGRDLPWALLFGVVGVAGLHGFYVVAVEQGGAALAAVLLYTAPAWVAIMSGLFLGEPMTRVKLIALGMTMAGVVMVSFGQDAGVTVTSGAVAFGLLSGFSYALYFIFGKRYLHRYATPTLFLYALPAGAAAIFPFTDFSVPTAKGFAACATLAVISTFCAVTVYYMGLKLLEATRAAVVATLEPVVAAVLAYFMFGEVFGWLGYLGSAAIIGAVLLTVTEGRRESYPVTRVAMDREPD